MKIDKVILQNIGVYVNRNEFDLQTGRPIILIGGMNGRGKTTLLDSIMFALYGRRGVENGLLLESYLRKIGNVTGECPEAMIEMQFRVQEQEETIYAVRRSWSIDRKHPKLNTRVWKNGVEDEVLSGNWDLFVEEILPRAIASFFFFDGEKIAELVASDNVREISSSIRSLMGIDVIDQLIADLGVVLSANQKKMTGKHHQEDLEKLKRELEQAEKKLQSRIDEEEKIRQREEQLKKEITDLENEHAAVGGYYKEYREKFQKEREEVQSGMEGNQTRMLELAASSLPLRMVSELLDDVRRNAENESEQKELQVFLKQFPVLYKDILGDVWNDQMEKLYSTVRNRVSNETPLYELDEISRERLSELPQILNQELKDAEEMVQESQELKERKEKIDNYLEVKVEDDKIDEIYERIKASSAELGRVKQKRETLAKEIAGLMSHEESVKLTRKSLLQQAVQEMDETDETARIIRYAQQQIEILEVYKKRLQGKKADELADEMTKCFKRLLAKDGLLSRIEIDHDTLEFSYYGRDGEKIHSDRFSAGEKQLLVIAMLWALGICSQAKFPLIIDTPLARLDSVHRTSLIENYFPYASEQVIILSTDQEITVDDYAQLKKYVGKEYTLLYNETTMSTSVQPGYFGR